MNTHESLSALMDGELAPHDLDRLLAETDADPALLQTWSRLCAARDAGDGTRIPASRDTWVSDLMQAVRAEPLPLALAHPQVASLAARRRRPIWQPLAGLAVAASVAMVAVTLSLNTAPLADPAVADSVSDPDAAAPVAAPRDLRLVSNEGVAQPLDADETWLLNNYLLEHNNALASQGVGGTLRYARFAAHTTDGVRPVSVSTAEDAR